MLRILLPIFLVCAFATRGEAQTDEVVILAQELCTCSGQIQPEASDRAVENAFRTCLENGILAHPKAMRALLEKAPSEVGPGYGLGLVLGELLESQCPHIKGLKDRLRKAIGAGSAPPGTT